MREPEIGSYHDADDARHTLVVRRSADGNWRVLDIDVIADTAQIVETLTDDHDGRSQAEAIARDYLTTVGGREAPTGPAADEAIPEQGGSDGRSHDRSHPIYREAGRRRGAALPDPAR